MKAEDVPTIKDKIQPLQDLMPDAEMEEILEQVKADEAKSNVLEKLQLDKQLQKEIEKQAREIEKEAEELGGDIDGFHLFKEEYEIPYNKDYQPTQKLDIEDEEDIDDVYENDDAEQNDFVGEKIDDGILESDNGVTEKMEEDAVDLEEDTFYLPLDEVKVTDEEIEKYEEDDLNDSDDFDEEDMEEKQKKEEKENKKKWSIVFSKKPELIIEKEEYDRILIDLLQSYADYKQTTIKMEELVEFEDELIVNNQENRRKTRRNSS